MTFALRAKGNNYQTLFFANLIDIFNNINYHYIWQNHKTNIDPIIKQTIENMSCIVNLIIHFSSINVIYQSNKLKFFE